MRLIDFPKSLALRVLVCALSLLLRAAIPTRVAYLGLHDDDWMVSNARWIADGDFIRKWTVLSMNKELGYPFFVALTMKLNISPVFFAHAIFVAISLALVQALQLHLSQKIQGLMLTALVLNPAIFGLTASRIYRDMLTVNLTLLLLVLVINLYRLSATKSMISHGGLTCVVGFIMSLWLRMTRIDTYWILVVVTIASTPAIFSIFWQMDAGRQVQVKSASFIMILLLGSIGVGQLIAPRVSAEINSRRYGVGLPDDFFAGEFGALLMTWSSISTESNVPYTPIAKDQRAKAYDQSSSLRQLKPLIEGDFSSGWRSISCQATGVCDDIAGGYFAHAVRDAYAFLYPNSSAIRFQKFMRTANRDLLSGCKTKKILCGARGINTQLPSIAEIDWGPTLKTAGSFIVTRSLRFNDSVSFNAVGPSDGPNAAAWQQLLKGSLGTRLIDFNGTPAWLRGPIQMGFWLMGWVLAVTISFGIFALCVLAIPQRWNLMAWVGLGSLIGVALHALVIAIAAQNSMGPLSFGGIWELTYLLQEVPFLVIAGIAGLQLLSKSIYSRQDDTLENRGN